MIDSNHRRLMIDLEQDMPHVMEKTEKMYNTYLG